MTPEQKRQIDSMSQYELCYMWRHAPIGHELLLDECGIYFQAALQKAGGFTPEISKRIGWGKPK